MDIDKKRIINAQQHNCAHCGTKGANYYGIKFIVVDENENRKLGILTIRCKCCNKITTHIIKNVHERATDFSHDGGSYYPGGFYWDGCYHQVVEKFSDLDDNIIMSIPTPTFIIDAGIPSKLRNLLIEALKCLKENALTGASACIRKSIYEFLLKEKAVGANYDEKIKSIKGNWSHLSEYLDVLKGIKGVVSDQVHEDSFESFSSDEIKYYIDILEEIFREVYVIPQQRQHRKEAIFAKFNAVKKDKNKIPNVK